MENKNGQGIFYGVIGVATLVVAIIGATFAYFSASGNVTYSQNIAGGTNDQLGGALSAIVEKVNLQSVSNVTSDNLVPTNLASDSELNLVKGAISANCANGGYTGCHLYRITASSTQTVAAATLKLEDLTVTLNKTGNSTKSDWQYIILSGAASDTGTTVTANSLALVTGAAGTCDVSSPVTIHNAGMTGGQNYVYYLLVFLHDDTASQNSDDANDATGTYTGHISLAAAGTGQITATFSASA